jgi:predicted negative regulator of RcsB-dependent stress response
MKRKEHITSFYLETLLLIIVFVGIILVLTQVFGLARSTSVQAKEKTSAVCLCQNAAEAFAAAESSQELLDLLNQNHNASLESADDNRGFIKAFYDTDRNPDANGILKIEVSWEKGEKTAGKDKVLRYAKIVASKDKKVIYNLETSVYDEEGWK